MPSFSHGFRDLIGKGTVQEARVRRMEREMKADDGMASSEKEEAVEAVDFDTGVEKGIVMIAPLNLLVSIFGSPTDSG